MPQKLISFHYHSSGDNYIPSVLCLSNAYFAAFIWNVVYTGTLEHITLAAPFRKGWPYLLYGIIDGVWSCSLSLFFDVLVTAHWIFLPITDFIHQYCDKTAIHAVRSFWFSNPNIFEQTHVRVNFWILVHCVIFPKLHSSIQVNNGKYWLQNYSASL